MNVKEQTIYSRAVMVGFALDITIAQLGDVEDEILFGLINKKLATLNEPALTKEEMQILDTTGKRLLNFFMK